MDSATTPTNTQEPPAAEASAVAPTQEEPVLTEKQLERKRRKEEAAKAARAKAEARAEAKAKADTAKPKAAGAAAPAPKKEKFLKKEYVNLTPKGHKKDLSQPMAAAYDPPAVEAAWYDWWWEQGYFQPADPEGREKFVIVIPPPNVTGALHLGHALTNSIQDVLIRWHRMRGHSVLWLPGIDHAGIATQVRVEKKLWAEQHKTRHDVGREAFINMVWEWKNEYGGQIQNQLRRLGSSLDWNREVFTLDEKLSTAVVEAFCRWFDEGKIYRATRLVHWCCTLNTAISDCEVEHVQYPGRKLIKVPGYGDELVEVGVLTSFAYKVVGSDEEVVVATTRPETMLGDTAVAVHPDDQRYKHLHGKMLQHPFIDRQIPLITDAVLVDMNFGTGAVKVTPSHDPNDYECGIRNKLPFINILNHNGTINENGGRFAGLKRFTARRQVTQALQELGLLRGKKDNEMSIATCSRSGDIIEPLIMPQWYVACKEIGKRAADAVRDGSLEIIPKSQESRWFYFMDDIRDWCISRQLWWGHRIPAYLVSIEGQPPLDPNVSESYVCGRSEEEAYQRAVERFKVDRSKLKLEQDPDVLDTWFSSGLFPFSTMGWPNTEHPDYKNFYPTSLLETGWDILFFWVARMVMMGLSFTDQLPFKQVFLHAMIRDAQGNKMSKSKGNVIDPIWVMEGATLEQLHATLEGGVLTDSEKTTAREGQIKSFPNGIGECGTDAMRFALCDYTQQDRDINLDIGRVEAFRAFCNKMWNATKFVLMQLGEGFAPAPFSEVAHAGPQRHKMEQWILSRLNAAIIQSNEGLTHYHFSKSTSACHGFWLYEFCDVFVECTKSMMANADDQQKSSIRNTLYTCLETALRLIHPYMPFVSEELWQRLPRRPGYTTESIMIAAYPEATPEWTNEAVEREVAIMMSTIQAIRSLRAQYKLQAKSRPTLWIRCKNTERLSIADTYLPTIMALCGSGTSTVINDTAEVPPGCAMAIVDDTTTVYVHLVGLVDIPKEIEKLQQLVKAREGAIAGLRKRMSAVTYATTPEEIKAQDADKIAKMQLEIDNAQVAIADYNKLL